MQVYDKKKSSALYSTTKALPRPTRPGRERRQGDFRATDAARAFLWDIHTRATNEWRLCDMTPTSGRYATVRCMRYYPAQNYATNSKMTMEDLEYFVFNLKYEFCTIYNTKTIKIL